ncbi:MAG: hypothetical protein ACREN7_02525 [Candidatus Dormibacteria bacterium]
MDRLQQQAASLRRQVQAQGQELATAGSAASQSELARSQGLVGPGEQAFAVETPVRAAGPATLEDGVETAGQTALGLARSFLVPAPDAPAG